MLSSVKTIWLWYLFLMCILVDIVICIKNVPKKQTLKWDLGFLLWILYVLDSLFVHVCMYRQIQVSLEARKDI